MPRKTWSIVIPVLNEEKNIARCLDSLIHLEFDLSQVEIIVVDNGSKDHTVAVAASFASRLELKILDMPSAFIGALRNAGAHHASGAFLSFLDSDCIVRPGWLRQAMETLQEHPEAIVGAHYALPSEAGWPARVWHRRFHKERSGPVSYIPGGNLLMAKATFGKVGGFDTALRSNEDSEMCARARAADVPVLAFPNLAVIHLGAEKNLVEFVRRQWWHGANVVSRTGFKTNRRALALAAYTLASLGCILLSALWLEPLSFCAGMAALVLPGIIVAAEGGKARAKLGHAAAVFVLVTIYGVVRAVVLPLSIVRGIRRIPSEGRSGQMGDGEQKCT